MIFFEKAKTKELFEWFYDLLERIYIEEPSLEVEKKEQLLLLPLLSVVTCLKQRNNERL